MMPVGLMPPTPGLERIAVVGMFDGVHEGHRYLLRQLRLHAAERSLKPLVITFANHPLSVIAPERAPKLIYHTFEKAKAIRDEGFSGDEILIMNFDRELRETSAADFLAMLRDRFGVRALLMGFNNRFGHDAPSDFDEYKALADKAGIVLIQARELPAEKGVCSSKIRSLIADGDVTAAAEMLGRPFSMAGWVVKGKALGRTLGFPTANLSIPRGALIPAPGVYAARAESKDGTYPAMVNIGRRPTVDAPGAPLSVEAHLIGLPEGTDLYNSQVTLYFIERLRSERRFATTEALRAQLSLDRDAALAVISTPR
ncbi:MAG: riboflavin biosynthesis protein RibF [[Clostridium] fimetarium]|nr:riboflavin biosynthesis protein RibF [Alistipes timonensis]MCM1406450.1 riboflavin biosynthesis protein RibF [[Clostridium] fimetarium]